MACSFFLFQNGIASCRISCPGALGACPIGSLQAVIGSPKYQLALYVSGVIILFGALMGHFVCGWLCPFGHTAGCDWVFIYVETADPAADCPAFRNYLSAVL